MSTRKNKYGAKALTVDGERFDSQAEYRRWCELRAMEMAGEIAYLQRQVPFSLDLNGGHICTYRADFCYRDANERVHVEDLKGVRTQAYIIKRALMKVLRGITIEEVHA